MLSSSLFDPVALGSGGEGPGEAGGESGGDSGSSAAGASSAGSGSRSLGGSAGDGVPRLASVAASAAETIVCATRSIASSPEAGCAEQLLGAFLGAADDHAGLRARPLERLLDLGADRVRELGRLVARLLEQPRRSSLGLRDLLRRLLLGLLQRLAGLALGGVHHLGALALALLAIAVDLALPLLEVALAPGHLFLGAAKLRGRSRLRVALDRVGHLGGGPDHVQRIHADGVPGRLDLAALPGGLEHAKLNLELRRVPAERLERLTHLLAVESVRRAREILHPWQRRQCRSLRRASLAFSCHPVSRLLERLAETAV